MTASADASRLEALERSLLAHDLILRSVLTHLAMTDPRGFEAMIGGFLNSNLYEAPGSAGDLTREVAEQLTRLFQEVASSLHR
jgi:hypothetical protein